MSKTWYEQLMLGNKVKLPKIQLQCDKCGKWFTVKVSRQYLIDWPYVENVCPFCGNYHERSWRWKRRKWDDVEF